MKDLRVNGVDYSLEDVLYDAIVERPRLKICELEKENERLNKIIMKAKARVNSIYFNWNVENILNYLDGLLEILRGNDE